MNCLFRTSRAFSLFRSARSAAAFCSASFCCLYFSISWRSAIISLSLCMPAQAAKTICFSTPSPPAIPRRHRVMFLFLPASSLRCFTQASNTFFVRTVSCCMNCFSSAARVFCLPSVAIIADSCRCSSMILLASSSSFRAASSCFELLDPPQARTTSASNISSPRAMLRRHLDRFWRLCSLAFLSSLMSLLHSTRQFFARLVSDRLNWFWSALIVRSR
mmetsp:Transcript_43890/g.124252  ORF Transcript_43890/g.124252 Transcript_43890/m.124252 type:complete len:218 (+) Transcript_43890:825-1478(+)